MGKQVNNITKDMKEDLAKRIFGIAYTPNEEYAIKQIIRKSYRYMINIDLGLKLN